MAKRSLAVQLDNVVEAMLVSLQPRPEPSPHRELASLLNVAQELRLLPRQEFRSALKTELQRRATMSEAAAAAGIRTAEAKTPYYMRPGITSITPYIVIHRAAEFIDFLKAVFGAEERLRVPTPDGKIMHAEVAIGNGAIETADANETYPSSPAEIHVYVEDADTTFARAVKAGATSILAPTDAHPSGDHWGTLEDQFGNRWHIATPKGWTPGPEGIRSVQPYLHLRDAHKMIPFVEATFGAEAIGLHKTPQGMVMHATLRIGNATFEISEAHGKFQPKPCHLHVYVPDTDAAYDQALRAGAASLREPENAPYGDRAAGVKDVFGNSWFIATYLGTR